MWDESFIAIGGLVEKLLLRPDEVAELLGVGRSKVYALLAKGDLPSVRLGCSVRVPANQLKDWLARHMSTSDGPPAERDGSRPFEPDAEPV
jgi:excisionase family DNA binding protein